MKDWDLLAHDWIVKGATLFILLVFIVIFIVLILLGVDFIGCYFNGSCDLLCSALIHRLYT
jgi:hypothetical protein